MGNLTCSECYELIRCNEGSVHLQLRNSLSHQRAWREVIRKCQITEGGKSSAVYDETRWPSHHFTRHPNMMITVYRSVEPPDCQITPCYYRSRSVGSIHTIFETMTSKTQGQKRDYIWCTHVTFAIAVYFALYCFLWHARVLHSDSNSISGLC